MALSPDALDDLIRRDAPALAQKIRGAAKAAHNEREFQTAVTRHIEEFADRAGLHLSLREEYTLINGRADAVYNRFVIEYEPPFSLREDNRTRANSHAIEQVRKYLQGLERVERHKQERLAGVAFDGGFLIFVRQRDKVWSVDDPVPVDRISVGRFLRTLSALSTELALIPDNLVRDFGPATPVSRQCIGTFYEFIAETANPKARKLYEQWSRMFSEVCDYDQASKLNVQRFARIFGVRDPHPDPFRLFFCIHTYYATFIKLLAVQVATYYMAPRLGTGLKAVASYDSKALLKYLQRMERGGIFKELGINNFLEGDFFQWYLDIWDDSICDIVRGLIAKLAEYSLVTLDVDPEQTRDLLKTLYQDLMPKELRHNLGEYYTPDWLAERLIGQVVGKRRQDDYPQCDPRKRYLDPACGSGTFLVLIIRFMRLFTEEHLGHVRESALLNLVLQNVIGFDLNPLAVISARTNYLLALGDLLQHRTAEINIPIYLADSIMTPSEGSDLHSFGKYRFNTAVGEFELPKALISAQYVDALANELEQCVEITRIEPADKARELFRDRLLKSFPLDAIRDARDIETATGLFEHLHTLERDGINGIWARIIKNAFAPVFTSGMDFVVGNPPWVNWESLPEQYRNESKSLWEQYGLFTLKGWRARMGGGKKDISILMTYVSIDKYLKDGGRLGFVITQTIFKTEGGAEGFRRFRLGEKGAPFRVYWVDDMSGIKPFEGAANRTAIFICDKGKPTKYPVEVGYWRKKPDVRGLPETASLAEVLNTYIRMSQWKAEPIDDTNPSSPWITGRPKALRAIKKVIGPSAYNGRAHEGSNTGGLNGVYWVEEPVNQPNGRVLVQNCGDIGKKKVESQPVALEPDLLFPLLRGQDVDRWKATPSLYIIMAQDPKTRKGWDEKRMMREWPKTYEYLKSWEDDLRKRSGYKKYFDPKADPFYSMYNVSHETFAPYKVVWREMATFLTAAVIGNYQGRVVVPDHKLMLTAFEDENEAHYVCALLGSSPALYIVAAYAIETGQNTHIYKRVAIPMYNPKDGIHRALAQASRETHKLAMSGDDPARLAEIESEIDHLAGKMWGMSEAELKEVQVSLRDLEE